MRTLSRSLLLAFALLFAVNLANNLNAGPAPQGEMGEEEMAAMMQAWQNFATPGEVHMGMKTMVGEWKTVTKHWMGPGEPTVSNGTATYQMVMGDRYLEGRHVSETPFGPMEGRSVMAYDNALKMYYSTWIDNMGTGLTIMSGSFDEKTKTYSMTGQMTDPSSAQMMDIRTEMKIISKDENTFTMWGTQGGHEFKMMEMTYTRA